MNILILFTHRWRGGRAGGAETHNLGLIKGLAARGHLVVAVTGPADSGCRFSSASGLSVHYELPFQTINPLDKLKSYRVLRDITARHNIEIVHAHHRTAGYFAELLCRERHLPYVVTVHDPWHSTPFKSAHGKVFRQMIAVSDFLKRILVTRFRVPPERIRTIRNGVDPKPFDAVEPSEAARFRSTFGISPETIVLSQISRISRAKGQFDLINALRLLPGDLNYRYLIVGEGKERRRLERLVESSGLAAKVTFCGYQANIPVVLAASDVMVLPSHREGLPLSIVEAMLAKVPVVAADTAGVPEIITDRQDGLLFHAGDLETLAKLLRETITDGELRQRLAECGRQTAVDRFLVNRMVEETESHYRRILDSWKG